MNDCEFIRVVTKDDEECFLLTKLKNEGREGFHMTLCHDGKVWTGSVSEDDLDTLSSRLKMNYDKYVKETVEALSNGCGAKQVFTYELTCNKDTAQFVWKKQVPGDDITFQLGSAMLQAQKDSPQMITTIYNHCISSINELKTRIQSLETDNQRLSQERINALKRLEKCVVAKEELETDLYSKFCLVLNSKKEKIRELKQQVQEGHSDTRTETQADTESQTAVKNGKRILEPSVDNSDTGDETDEDTPKTKKGRTGTQKKKDSGGDDSLILGNDEEEAGPVVSRNRRQRGKAQKKQTPSKPVLPRVGSGDATPGSESKTRLRTRGSANSNRSSDNIDADDLMGDL